MKKQQKKKLILILYSILSLTMCVLMFLDGAGIIAILFGVLLFYFLYLAISKKGIKNNKKLQPLFEEVMIYNIMKKLMIIEILGIGEFFFDFTGKCILIWMLMMAYILDDEKKYIAKISAAEEGIDRKQVNVMLITFVTILILIIYVIHQYCFK